MKKKKTKVIDTAIEPEKIAEFAGLEYVKDNKPGIQRKSIGKSFKYIGVDGKIIKNPDEIERINSLAIPPAYSKVWICPKKTGHLQATGFDAKGRKQYRYHKQWRKVSDETKFNKMLLFAKVLPKIRKKIDYDLTLPGMPKKKVLAAIVYLLENTLIRVGNEEYVKENDSFGLTTFRNRHVNIEGSKIVFKFKGKSGKQQSIALNDPRIARIVKKCKDLPGQELFEYVDDTGNVISVTSSDVNSYIQNISQEHFTAKDFRTWAATVIAIVALQNFLAFESETEAKKNIIEAVSIVAKILGNTPAICRKAYIHPDVFIAYSENKLIKLKDVEIEIAKIQDLFNAQETAILAFFEKRLGMDGGILK